MKEGSDGVEYMNAYYAIAGYNLLNSFNTTWQPNIDMFEDYPGFSVLDITEHEVTKLIKDINILKSSVYCEISSRLFKDAFSVMVRELTFLFNKCLNEGIFTLDWGLAEVTPIPKQVT